MRIMAAIAVAGMAGGIAIAQEIGPAAEPTVTVCMELGNDVQALKLAEKTASHMFEEVGVKVEWSHYPRPCPAEKHVIVVSLSYDTYEGTHIVVFYDRIQKRVVPARVPILLAHVLVHEITHILQGVVRHSSSGVMKARWDSGDFFEMARKSLGFTKLDVVLIRRGLEARQSLVAANPASGGK
jgi:hypothetical protein